MGTRASSHDELQFPASGYNGPSIYRCPAFIEFGLYVERVYCDVSLTHLDDTHTHTGKSETHGTIYWSTNAK